MFRASGFDYHKEVLSKLCRICGNKRESPRQLKKAHRGPTFCKNNRKEIFAVFKISTWNDCSDQHPSAVCEKCARKIRHYKAQSQDYIDSIQTEITWVKHQRAVKCGVCEHFEQLSQPGKKKKGHRTVGQSSSTSSPGIPFSVETNNIFPHIIPDRVADSDPFIEILGREEEHSLFTCPICLCLLPSPSVQATCEHHFCVTCLTKYFQFKKQSTVSCPVCKELINFCEVSRGSRVLNAQLQNLNLICTKCCRIGKAQKIRDHTCTSTCTSLGLSTSNVKIVKTTNACTDDDSAPENDQTSAVAKAAKMLAQEARNHVKGQPIPYEIEQATDRWTWLKLQQSNRETTLNTGGRPAYVKQVPQAKRTMDDGSSSLCTKKQKTADIKEPSSSSTHNVPANKALAMMRDCHLAWDQVRKLRRYIGPTIASERSMRTQQKNLLKDGLLGELVELVFPSTRADGCHGREYRMMPYVRVKDLSKMVLDYLDRLDKCGALTWHHNTIPPDEIWVKIGGDKGGTSFKMAFQIVNVHHPNSLKNTVVFACYEGSDTAENLERTFPKVSSQVNALAKRKWRGCTIHLFCFGDYELLTKIYGTLGPNARYCCIYCLASKESMQKPLCDRGLSPKRTLHSINEHHRLFCEDGSRKDRAKDVSFSIVNAPKLQIAIDHVILPSLHISLGVFKKLFDLYESECHALDVQLFKMRVDACDDDTEFNFDQAVSAEVKRQQGVQAELDQKKAQLEEIEDDLPLMNLHKTKTHRGVHEAYKETVAKAAKAQAEIDDLERQVSHGDLQFATGPIASRIDRVLSKHTICRQAYHGKSFVGNHVHKCCQIAVIKDLTSVPVEVISEAKSDAIPIAAVERLMREAAVISMKYSEILLKFADVHRGINHSNKLTNDEIMKIDVCIRVFMQCFRAHFPSCNISPKMHLLEDHAVEQLQKYRVGFGLLNEQGGELVHTEFNRAGRVVHGMKNPLQRLLSVMRRHHTTTAPEIRSCIQQSFSKEE